MPGAWEQVEPSVLVVILTREFVHTKWAMCFRDMQLPPGSGIAALCGMPFDHARNHGCSLAVRDGYKHIMFVDDDVLVPPDVYARLVRHNKAITSGVYFRRSPPLYPCFLRDTPEGTGWVQSYPANTLIEVDLVGAGCLLISTDLIRQMGSRPFDWRSDHWDLPPKERLSEDFAFCRRAKREFGQTVYVDTSVQCTHIGAAESFGGEFRALTW